MNRIPQADTAVTAGLIEHYGGVEAAAEALHRFVAKHPVPPDAPFGPLHGWQYLAAMTVADGLRRAGTHGISWAPQQAEADPEAAWRRRQLRWLATLPALRQIADLDVLADLFATIVAHPDIDASRIRAALTGWLCDPAEPSIVALQHAARLLADRLPVAQVAAQSGCPAEVVTSIHQFLAIAEWRATRDLELGQALAHAGIYTWDRHRWGRTLRLAGVDVPLGGLPPLA